jgi:hypothetical protein
LGLSTASTTWDTACRTAATAAAAKLVSSSTIYLTNARVLVALPCS